jgi:hypothetical protein
MDEPLTEQRLGDLAWLSRRERPREGLPLHSRMADWSSFS